MSFFEPGPVRVKICGVTNAADAELAASAGADAVGVNFFSGSKRFVRLDDARDWLTPLAGRVDRIAVVVNATAEELARLRDAGCFDAIQFHGDETPDFCATHGGPRWLRAVRVRDRDDLRSIFDYKTPYLLMDAWKAGEYGGTGLRADWGLVLAGVAAGTDRRIILAGGLTPENVAEAVRATGVHGVDVAGGVEADPRHKDSGLVRAFVQAARAAGN